MLFITLLSIIVSIHAQVLNQTTTVTVHIGDNGNGHYMDNDYLFGEAIAVLFFIIILIGCVSGFWAMDDHRHIPIAQPLP